MNCKFKNSDGSCDVYSLISINGYNKVKITNEGVTLDGKKVENVTELKIKVTEDNKTTVTIKFDADVDVDLTDECCGDLEDIS